MWLPPQEEGKKASGVFEKEAADDVRSSHDVLGWIFEDMQVFSKSGYRGHGLPSFTFYFSLEAWTLAESEYDRHAPMSHWWKYSTYGYEEVCALALPFSKIGSACGKIVAQLSIRPKGVRLLASPPHHQLSNMAYQVPIMLVRLPNFLIVLQTWWKFQCCFATGTSLYLCVFPSPLATLVASWIVLAW